MITKDDNYNLSPLFSLPGESDIKQSFGKKEKIINTSFLKITNNILYFNKYFLQINNISQVSLEKKKKPYTKFLVLLFLISISVSLLVTGYDLKFKCWVITILCGILLLIHLLVKDEYLTIALNSGDVLLIYTKDNLFLYQVFGQLIKYINNNAEVKSMSVNFVDKQITNNVTGSTVGAMGDGNNVTMNMSSASNISINWDELLTQLLEAQRNLPSNSKELELAQQLIAPIVKKDEGLLKKALTKSKEIITSPTFTSIVSPIAVELFKKLLGI